jgi:hypothetical protein
MRRSRLSRRYEVASSTSEHRSAGGVGSLIAKAKLCHKAVGIDPEQWNKPTWSVSPSIFKLTGRNVVTVTMCFLGPDKPLGALGEEWEDVAKSIFVLRQHQKATAITSHRAFISAMRYVVCCAKGRAVSDLTPQMLDDACELIKKSIDSKNQRYKYMCMIGEFARKWCARYELCHTRLADYCFRDVQRPDTYGGPKNTRLDSVSVLDTATSRVMSERSLAVLGKLYQKVPKDHAYRVYILLLVILFCVGRRFSEIAFLPRRCIVRRSDGDYFRYIETKKVGALEQRDYLSIPVLDEVRPLLRAVIAEIKWSSRSKYSTASEMLKSDGPDLRFLQDVPEHKALFQRDLLGLGLPSQCLSSSGWFYKYNRIKMHSLESGGRIRKYILKQDIIDFCQSQFQAQLCAPIFNVGGSNFTLKDMLLVRLYGASSGFYAHWMVRPITHSMLTTFFRYIDELTDKYCSSYFDQDFTSHIFRHTLNDALDKGGLSDVMQSEFFGRKYDADTKSYQHSSPQYRALQLREKIKSGQVGGAVAELAMNLPVDKQELYLNSEVRALHDVGLGMCLHVWSHGPCEKHLECCGGCGKLAWLKGLEGETKVKQVAEVKRQICSNLLVLCNAFDASAGNVGGVEQWVSHLFVKIKTLKQILRDTDASEASFNQYGDFWMSTHPLAHQLDLVRINKAYDYFLANHERYLTLIEVSHGQ